MPTVVKKLTKEEAQELFEGMKVENRMTPEMRKSLEKQGWTFDSYSMEKVYKGYPLVIEFCIGDFCTYPCSKRGHWLLEPKFRAPTFMDAVIHIITLEERIDAGEKWQGEND